MMVDISKNLYIIGASMIEARTSRVRLPRGSGTGEGGKGLPPRLWPSRLREPEPGRGIRSLGLSSLFGDGALSWIQPVRVYGMKS